MKKHYRIADVIPLEARRAAAEATYRKRRTDEGFCPLGVILHELVAMGKAKEPPSGYEKAPPASIFARAIVGRPDRGVWNDAWEFIGDWDTGKIRYADLAKALGVDEGQS